MMPTIRIEDDVFEGLQSLIKAFSDTPNTVIRRLLIEKGIIPPDEKPAPPDEAKRDATASNDRTAHRFAARRVARLEAAID